MLLHGFGIFEVALALWILSGKKIFYPCVIAAVMLLGIVYFNMAQFEVLFRDLSIAALCLGLAFMHSPYKIRTAQTLTNQ